MPHDVNHEATDLSDAELRLRTRQLVVRAEALTSQLIAQTELLAEAVRLFEREVLTPFKEI